MVLLLILLGSLALLYTRHYYFIPTQIQQDPLPKVQTLVAQEKYSDAYEYLDYFMQFDYMKDNEEAKKVHESLSLKRNSFEYKKDKILEGILTGTSDELSGQVSAIGSDFFLFGDIRDLVIQGKNYFNKEEVDGVLVGLSSVGLVASASTLLSAGATTAPKAGVSVLKLARKQKYMPNWLAKFITKEAKVVAKTKNIKSVKPLLESVQVLYKNAGLQGSMKLLSKSKNLMHLSTISKYAKRFGKESHVLLKTTNGSILKHLPNVGKSTTKNIKVASTFGEGGLKSLSKVGDKNFIKSIKTYKSIGKVGYKGEYLNILLKGLNMVNDMILWMSSLIAGLFLVPWRLKRRTLA
ncbi:MAG: Unknown protein [uncultured Sulfurovum sp.]|uniref:Uncharacterized protein n=1 Tax=uncultured Sulfurovum sp. TaxID=269237 RepID=A0A6S6TNK7_9BACT|nr:MAG: Unknown protein [uncultured Sulfurovum sp.]